jgi:hypothetical protein
MAVMGSALLAASQAHAHFKLLSPASWLNEDMLGGPQKGSPCGPGNTRPFIGDDVQPVPVSSATTTFKPGETISVEWQETVYHAGYWRISFAPKAPADVTSTDFPDPALTELENCHYDKSMVKTSPHDNVLADGLFMVDEQSGTGRSLKQEIKLPDQPCEHCTLQIVQVMEGHPASSCYYFHCAEIKIAPAQGMSAAASGSGAAEPPAAHEDSGGCTVARVGAGSLAPLAWFALLGLAFARRRR